MTARNMREAEILVRLARAGVHPTDLDQRLKQELEFEGRHVSRKATWANIVAQAIDNKPCVECKANPCSCEISEADYEDGDPSDTEWRKS